MSCVALEQLAAAAAGEDEDALAHARACARCAALIGDQQTMRSLARSLPRPELDLDHRTVLAAELMARADALPRRRTRLVVGLGAALAAAAATIALVVRVASTPAPSLAIDTPAADVPPIHVPDRVVTTEPAPAAADEQRAIVQQTADADLTRDTTPERDLVTLRAGRLSIDASRTRSLQVLAGSTRVEVARARAAVTAKRGAIETVRVYAGSVEVIDGGRRYVIVAGATWERLQPTEPTTPAIAMAAFRDGWTALRAGDHAIAIAAFDRATDPVVAEDATYWAAIAAERAGRTDDARRRFADFVTRFAASPRIAAARAALQRLSP